MINTVPSVERRRGGRQSIFYSARARRWRAPESWPERTCVVETGDTGLRIRTGLDVRPDDVLELTLDDLGKAVCAEVVWTRREGLIEKGPRQRIGGAFVAGCRLLAKPPPRRLDGLGSALLRGLSQSMKPSILIAAGTAILCLFSMLAYGILFLCGLLSGKG